MIYDKEKIKRFYEFTLEDYKRSLIIENITKVEMVEKTDGSFIQVGIRPLIDEDIFISPSFSEYLPSAGRMVAIGEEELLIKSILETENIERIGMEKNIWEFSNNIYFEDEIILLSTKFYVEVFTKLMNRIDYGKKYPQLDKRYKIITVPEKILGNKIIILGKNAFFWEKQLFDNKLAGKKEILDITIKPHSAGKVDITIRSVNKIKHIDSELIKILEINYGKS